MAARRRSVGTIALILFLGIVVGTVLGEVVGLVLPEGKVIRDVFVNSLDYHFGPHHVDLVVFGFTVGFSLSVNLMGVIGLFAMILLLRWFW